jgi:hypothetical protein
MPVSAAVARSLSATSLPPIRRALAGGLLPAHQAPFLGSWAQVPEGTPPLPFRSQAMRPPPPAQGPPQKATTTAVKTMEEEGAGEWTGQREYGR